MGHADSSTEIFIYCNSIPASIIYFSILKIKINFTDLELFLLYITSHYFDAVAYYINMRQKICLPISPIECIFVSNFDATMPPLNPQFHYSLLPPRQQEQLALAFTWVPPTKTWPCSLFGRMWPKFVGIGCGYDSDELTQTVEKLWAR